MKLKFVFILLAGALLAQRPMTVAELTSFIKSAIKLKNDDRTTAEYLRKIKMTQRLDDKTVEELQGLGAGPKTVAALRLLEEGSASLAAAPPPPPPAPKAPPKPPPDSVEQAEVIASMREYALNYTSRLPNFLCAQTTRRHTDPRDPKYRPQGDVILEQISFFDHKENYKVQAMNGQSVHNISHDQIGGVRSSGEWGSMLHNIFAPEDEAQFEWDHWGTLRGRLMYVFAYRIEKDRGYSMGDDETRKSYTSAYTGLVYADMETKEIERITLKTVEIPSDFPIKDVAITLDYKPTDISGHIYTLPFHYELDSVHIHGNSKSEADFKLYQVYGADTTISFGDDTGPPPEDQLKEQPAKPVTPVKKPE
ncbi:MAG: hypothetical protein ABSF22_01670 [Bryobacteraceae bacterium]